MLYYFLQAFLHKKDHATITTAGNTLLDVLRDLDRVLSTDSHFLMGNWIEAARAQGSSEQVFLWLLHHVISHILKVSSFYFLTHWQYDEKFDSFQLAACFYFVA